MTTYRNIHGRPIQAVTTDPTESVAEGQIWYNTTSDTFKSVLVTEAFSAGGSAMEARWGAMSFGSQTAGVMAAGNTATARTGVTEEYNGSGFSTGGTAGTARYRGGGAGTETAGLIFGGESPGGDTGDTEEYNGSSWSEQNNLSKARRTTGFGVQTAAYAVGGYDNANKQSQVESYDGTSWTSGTALPLAGLTEGGSGTTSSGRTCGGFFGPGATHPPSSPQTTNNNIGWNGSSWSDDTALPSNRYNTSGFGTSADDYYAAGGRATPPNASINTVNYWNGTSWTVSPSLATARYNGQGQNGTPTAFVYMSGNASGTVTTATEEFNKSAIITTGASWASSNNMGTARYKISSANAAPQDAGLGFGGRASSGGTARDLSEEYNGTTWSEGNNLNNETRGAVGAGTQTAGLRAGGYDGGPAEQDNTEEYDGTSWSNANDMPANMRLGAGCGTQTAGLAFGGLSSPLNDKAVEYDGTNWTVGGTMNTGRYYMAGFGVQTAAVCAGGNSKDDTEEYDGTSWTSVNDLTSGNTEGGSAGGTLAAGLFFGGTRTSVPAPTSIALNYDGTNWSTTAAMGTARVALGGAGTNTVGLAFGGNAPPQTAATEEFTGETTSLNVKTLTQS